MVRSKNTNGHAAVATVINMALVAGVFAAMVAAVGPLIA